MAWLEHRSWVLMVATIGAISCVYGDNGQERSAPSICLQEPTTHFLIRGDLLYWIPQISGLDSDFGDGTVYQSTTTGGVLQTTVDEEDEDPHFDWSFGYRVALAYQFMCNRWEVNATWTHFQGKGHEETNRGKWRVKLDQIDAVAAYSAALNSKFLLHSFVGLRGTYIHQKLFSVVLTDVVFSPGGTATDTRTFNDSERFSGIGPVFGFNGDLNLGYGFGLYGMAGASVLYGTYRLHFDDMEVVTPPATASQVFSTIHKHMTSFDFATDLALGVSWQKCIRNAAYLALRVGVENHQYFDQSRLGSNWGNLSFSGLISSISVEF